MIIENRQRRQLIGYARLDGGHFIILGFSIFACRKALFTARYALSNSDKFAILGQLNTKDHKDREVLFLNFRGS
jgi:hypothetical protein